MFNIFLMIILVFLLIRIDYDCLLYFQQNRYEARRYYLWMKSKFFKIIDFKYFIFISLMLIFYLIKANFILTYTLLFLYALITLIIFLRKKYIKALVFTRRVKVQVFVLVLIQFILCIYFNSLIYFILLELLSYFLIYIMHLITLPLELLIARRYLLQAKEILRNNKFKIIGITGSYGKTSTKHTIFSVVNEQFYSYMTPASFNTPMGITKSIRENLKKIHQVFVCEMGADKVNDIKQLMEFVKPDISVITSIGPQHLATFKNIENIIKEKMKAVEMLGSDGVAIINIDNEYINNYQIKNKCIIKKISLKNNDADYYAYDIKCNQEGSSFKVKIKNNTYDFKTKLIGKHNIMNCLAAIAVGDVLDMEYTDIYQGIKKQNYVPHRLELKKINGFTFIDNAFNSNPVSSKLSIDTLSIMDFKKIVITPGFIDLGSQENFYNYEFGKYMADKVDVVYLVGINQTKAIYQGLKDNKMQNDKIKVVKDINEAIKDIYQHFLPNEVIILLENDLPDAFSN